MIHGSIFRFEGQVTVFEPGEGPCYRCLFPQPPPPELAPSCAEGGVLGVLPGIIGSLQANEALKLALGIGDRLTAGSCSSTRSPRPSPRSRSGRTRSAPCAASHRRSRSTSTTSSSAKGRGHTHEHGSHPSPAPRRDPGQPVVAAEGGTLGDLLDDLVARFPASTGSSTLRNVYVDGEDIRVLDELETPVDATSTVILLPAMAGGL